MGALTGRRCGRAIVAVLISIFGGSLAACQDTYVDLRLEGEGRYDEVVIEWRTPRDFVYLASAEESVWSDAVELPTTLRLRPPPYMKVEDLRELAVRLRSHDSGFVAAGATAVTLSSGERSAATLPIRWRFERREIAFASATAGQAQDLIGARLHCDGGVDLAALREKQVTLLRNDGTAHFAESTLTAATLFWHPPSPNRLWADDLNNDSRVDLIGGSADSVQLFLNQSTTPDCAIKFTATPQGTPLKNMIDFRTFHAGSRAFPDLAILDAGGTYPTVQFGQNILNTPPNTNVGFNLGTPIPTATYARQFARVRLPGDDVDDFVVANCTDTLPVTDVFASQNGALAWTAKSNRHNHKTPCALIAADFDGTGAAQVMIGFREEKSLAHVRIEGDGTLTFGAASRLALSRGSFGNLGSGDLDGDGVIDVVFSTLDDPIINIARGAGGGALDPVVSLDASIVRGAVRYVSNALSAPVVVEDFDGDGRKDLAMGSAEPAGVVVFLNRSAD